MAAAAADLTRSSPNPTFGSLQVHDACLHYVRAGEGPQALLHGLRREWSEYRQIMPRCPRRFTVIAVDLRDIGKSAVAGARRSVVGRSAATGQCAEGLPKA